MLFIGLLLLITTSSSLIHAEITEVPEATEAPINEVILREDIFKDRSKSTWMNCNFHADIERCSWTLGPLGKRLSSDEPEDSLSRHKVELSNTSNSCLLRIDDINLGDEGYYECSSEDDPPKFRWQLVIQGDPGPPVIFYANGTPVWDDMIAIDETPVTLHLRCLSTGAKPKHKRIFWLVDGNATEKTRTQYTGPIGGLWEATSDFSVTFDEDDEMEYRVKRVTCVTLHATARRETTKVFGIRNTNDTLHLIHYELPTWDKGKLQCETEVFPAPSKFEIMRLKTHPTQEDLTHHGHRMYVKHDGRYSCRAAVEIYRSSMGDEREYVWLNDSNIVEIGDDTEYLESTAQPQASGQLWKGLFGIYVLAITLLILHCGKVDI